MAKNLSPEVAAARDFSKKFDANRVIVFYTTASGRFGFASYGQTPKLCCQASRAANTVYDRLGQAIAAEAAKEK